MKIAAASLVCALLVASPPFAERAVSAPQVISVTCTTMARYEALLQRRIRDDKLRAAAEHTNVKELADAIASLNDEPAIAAALQAELDIDKKAETDALAAAQSAQTRLDNFRATHRCLASPTDRPH